ncbi:hypothetical protein K2173_014372 [Erythroxylum novogranatense]|uniref:RecF/RecN/SMC N-terminal domain-containing protein n=1 Tax=Erythroxylum novogranatense TaxID=1862640 RepID=A0AAV8S761_9ROSI|nr:hypothetical protein K2173_014372 [Erythroxylum novogranatense]
MLDVKNALHGSIAGDLHGGPIVYEAKVATNIVCNVNKALYGLKQSPRAWFGDLQSYILVYVDDIILTVEMMRWSSRFEYFLGIEVAHSGEEFLYPNVSMLIYLRTREVHHSSQSIQHDRTKHIEVDRHFIKEKLDIDIENPCIIMGQDSSRDFLHSGNDKDKFLKDKNMEHIEELSQQVQELKKKLAWSWVYQIDRRSIPKCQAKIDWELMMQKTSEVRKSRMNFSTLFPCALTFFSGNKRKLELEEEHDLQNNQILSMTKRIRSLEQQLKEIHEQHVKNTQAEESEIEEKIKELQYMVDTANSELSRLKEQESVLSETLFKITDEGRKVTEEVMGRRSVKSVHIRDLQQHKTNKVTAFGGDRVIQLLQAIERHHQRFNRPPIGPIGAHISLADGDAWAPAVENAIGKLLNAFIVTNHKDSLLLRRCAIEHMRPQTNNPTTLAVIHSDNDTVLNVLVDLRQVLVEDYDAGKAVAFEKRISNLKEVYTLDGYKMFSRGSVQTVLPPNKKLRTGRLCASYDSQIMRLEEDATYVRNESEECRKRKRDYELNLQDLQHNLKAVKERCMNAERDLSSKKLALQDVKSSRAPERSPSAVSTVDELHQEISVYHPREDSRKKNFLEMLRSRINEAEANNKDLRLCFENFCDSAKEELEVFEKAERELMEIEKDLQSAEAEKAHYESIMTNKVLHDIKVSEAQYRELEENRKENCKKASIICPEDEFLALGGWDGIKERKILRKQQSYRGFREKLKFCQEALDLRWRKFERTRKDIKCQLTWKFNDHLGKKGISGMVNVDYEKRRLVTMPQDASSSTVRDARGLSGGERSFSTICFTLALHEMAEAPFRAMDEFDVFMDAVSRKISLDTLLDFALTQGSQWIIITPHDIRDRVKKQQMAAPRS